MIPLWLYALLIRLGLGHWCRYDDEAHPEYVGFTCGICYRRGIHRGARPTTNREDGSRDA